ncbi:MAG TPA: hypothetical protein VGA99_09590 [bacterium]
MNKRFTAKYTAKSNLPAVPKIDLVLENYADPSKKVEGSFVIDSGADFTIIGKEFRSLLDLKAQGKPFKYYDIDFEEHVNDVTWVYVEIPKLNYKRSIKAAISNNNGCNFLGRNFLNHINVFLLGTKLRYILHVEE